MSVATVTAYRSRFAGRFMPSGIRKNSEIKSFRRARSTSAGKAHCIKDYVFIDDICGSSEFPVGIKINSEVIWSEKSSIGQ